MDLQLKGLTAVVTGGSGGIGGAIVEALADEGCNVAFCSRSRERVDAMLSRLARRPVKSSGKVVDATDSAGIAAWFAEIGAFDIFIPAISAMSQDFTETMHVDIQSNVAAIELALPYVRNSSHGAITYIGSMVTSLAVPVSKPYGIAKAGMAHYVKTLGRELAPTGIRVNTVSPGNTLVEGGTWDRVRQYAPEYFETALRHNPMGRLATGEEVARVVTFISSPAASFVIGADWFVDGAASIPLHE